jgi:hypothetical protein
MATLAEIRAKLAQQDSKNVSNSVDNAVYAHWNIPENSTTTIRFVPDGNTNNIFFWVEKAMIRLPFNGIAGQPNSKAQIVQVPCVEMWGDKCPVLTEVRTWFKDPSMGEMGRKYWKKKSYLFQGFVVDPGSYKEDSVPENPIRRFIISPQLFNLIKAALMDPDMQDLPTDYMRGTDFRITKTTKGQYADYNTSSWARRERALSEAEMAAIQTHGLNDLASFLPKRPNDVELKIIMEMFEASVSGEAYDPARWSQHFRPSGFAAGAEVESVGAATAPAVARIQPAKTVEVESTPFEVTRPVEPVAAPVSAPAQTSSKRAEDIIAALKARNNKA